MRVELIPLVRLGVAWARSLTAYLFLCVYVALVGPPALLVTILTGRVNHVFELGVVGARVARVLLGVRLVTEGVDQIRADRPAVYCVNHRSHVDAVVFEVMYHRCPKLRVLYKAEMERVPILGPAMRLAGFVPVHREHRGQAFDAIDSAAKRLSDGYSFLLAPEGTRGSSATMLPFKKGGFVMAIKGQVPVIPMVVVGAGALMPRGQLYVRSGQVTVRIGPEVPTAGLTLADRDQLSSRVRARMESLLAQSSQDTPG